MTDKIRILIADDHTIVRSGVRLLLQAEPDVEVVGEALDGAEAVAQAEALQPDVILMDIAMPGTNGLEATRQIKSQFPDMAVLVLTMHRSDEYFFEMLKAGASGYVLKGAETSELIGALRTVARGDVFFYPSMAKQLLRDYLDRVRQPEDADHAALTPREKEILRLIADGHTAKDIAAILVVSPSTIHSHQSNLMTKLGLNSRFELVQYARKRGLISDF